MEMFTIRKNMKSILSINVGDPFGTIGIMRLVSQKVRKSLPRTNVSSLLLNFPPIGSTDILFFPLFLSLTKSYLSFKK